MNRKKLTKLFLVFLSAVLLWKFYQIISWKQQKTAFFIISIASGCVCITIDYTVFSPNHVSVRQHLLIVRELQVDGEGDFGSSQGWWIIPDIKDHPSTLTKRTICEFLYQPCTCSWRTFKDVHSVTTDLPFQESWYFGSPSLQIGYIFVFHDG